MLYKTIKTNIVTEIIEKKSRFICMLNPVTDTNQVEKVIANVRKQYPGANHYCYAYRIRNDGNVIEKYSDDGEPNGTAGVPMLNVLKRQDIVNILAVVVRYFGGTLLGTGGLVRAYSGAVIQSLDQAEIITMEYSWQLRITVDYCYYGNFQNKCLPLLKQIVNTNFADRVIIEAWIAVDKLSRLLKVLDDITTRTAHVEYLQQDFMN
ncbi:MAG: YigZ family protein [Syntrophomonadaceae bacterium]|nr:YigZ family protein [Syntrophomonadaceae bacterium]